jgi:hypothetical protein
MGSQRLQDGNQTKCTCTNCRIFVELIRLLFLLTFRVKNSRGNVVKEGEEAAAKWVAWNVVSFVCFIVCHWKNKSSFFGFAAYVQDNNMFKIKSQDQLKRCSDLCICHPGSFVAFQNVRFQYITTAQQLQPRTVEDNNKIPHIELYDLLLCIFSMIQLFALLQLKNK